MRRASPRFSAASQRKKAAPSGPRPTATISPQSRSDSSTARLEHEVAEQRQHARHQPEQADDRRREVGDAARQQRVAGPDEGRAEGRQVAPGEAAAEARAAEDGEGRADEAGEGRADVHRPQLHPRQEQRREHDDEQRPEVVDEVGLDRRGVAQGDEQQEVEAEQAVDAERQRRRRHPPLPRQRPGRHAADHQRQPGEEKRRHVAEGDAERGQGRPERDRAEREQGRAHRRAAGRLSARSATASQMPTPISTARTGLAPRSFSDDQSNGSSPWPRRSPRLRLHAGDPLAPTRQVGIDRVEPALDDLRRRLLGVRLQQRRELLDRGVGLAQARDGERRAALRRSSSSRPAAGRRRRRRTASPAAAPSAAARRARSIMASGSSARASRATSSRLGTEVQYGQRSSSLPIAAPQLTQSIRPRSRSSLARSSRDIGRSSPFSSRNSANDW